MSGDEIEDPGSLEDLSGDGTPLIEESTSLAEARPPGEQRKIYSSLVSGFGTIAVVSVLGAVVVRAITVGQGAAAYGIFVLVTAFVSLVQNFSSLGLAQILQRDIAKAGDDEARLLSLAMGLRVTMGLLTIPIAGAIGYAMYSHHSRDLKIGLAVALCVIPFAAAAQVAATHFSAQLRNVLISTIAVVQQAIIVVLIILIVYFHKSIVYSIAAVVVGGVVGAILTVAFARREVKFSWAYDRHEWISMLKISTPVGLAYIIGTIYLKADTLILGVMSTPEQVGFYGVAYAVLTVFLVLPGILTRTFLPTLARATNQTIAEATSSAMTYFAIVGTLATTGCIVCAPTVVRIFAGTNFAASVAPLRILSVGLIFIFVTSGLSSVCVARGATRRLFLMSAISLVLNVALNIALIPTFGIKGSASATVICEVIALASIAWIVRHELTIKPQVLRTLFRPLLAAVVTCAALFPVYASPNYTLLQGLVMMPVLAIIYFGVLAIVRGIPDELVSSARSVALGRHGRMGRRKR